MPTNIAEAGDDERKPTDRRYLWGLRTIEIVNNPFSREDFSLGVLVRIARMSSAEAEDLAWIIRDAILDAQPGEAE